MTVATREIRWLLQAARRPKLRTRREFLEQELWLPTGPQRGLRFSCAFMPFTGLILDEFDKGEYQQYYLSGPVQGGKSLLGLIAPVLYSLFEEEESVIMGIPDLKMAWGIFQEKLLPSIRATRYAHLLPRRGAGSRGGRFDMIEFGNGATLRFMGAAGGDEQRSSHTAPNIALTELDKMDEAGEVSREADPVTQIISRSDSFNDRARIYGECTMSTSWGRIHREIEDIGINLKVWAKCPMCGEYVVCEREGLVGWQGADNVLKARVQARYACPSCSAMWDDAARREAIRFPVLAARDQHVSRDGVVSGPLRPTRTWSCSWNAMASGLTDLPYIAEHEWRAEKSGQDSDTRRVTQFVWALPYDADQEDLSDISYDAVLAKIGRGQRGVCPDDTRWLTAFVDLGLHWLWWGVVAWNESGCGTIVDYGPWQVPQGRDIKPIAILGALRSLWDEVFQHGWQWQGKPRQVDLTGVDSGYQADIAYQFCVEHRPRFVATKGQGTRQAQEAWHAPKPAKGRRIGHEWFMEVSKRSGRLIAFHSDYWKRAVHAGFAAPMGAPGGLILYDAPPLEHSKFARQIIAEREIEEYDVRKGTVRRWIAPHKSNHYLDVMAGCRMLADALGMKVEGVEGSGAVQIAAGVTARRPQEAVSGGRRGEFGADWTR